MPWSTSESSWEAGKWRPAFWKPHRSWKSSATWSLGWLHLWQGEVASEKLAALRKEAGAETPEDCKGLAARNPDAAFLEGKVATAKYFMGRILPLVSGKVAGLKQKETSPLDMSEEAFGAI